jgi:hypothetical protein
MEPQTATQEDFKMNTKIPSQKLKALVDRLGRPYIVGWRAVHIFDDSRDPHEVTEAELILAILNEMVKRDIPVEVCYSRINKKWFVTTFTHLPESTGTEVLSAVVDAFIQLPIK